MSNSKRYTNFLGNMHARPGPVHALETKFERLHEKKMKIMLALSPKKKYYGYNTMKKFRALLHIGSEIYKHSEPHPLYRLIAMLVFKLVLFL